MRRLPRLVSRRAVLVAGVTSSVAAAPRRAGGAPPGPWPLERGDGGRTGTTRARWPARLEVLARLRTDFTFRHGGVATPDGGLVVPSSTGALVRLGARTRTPTEHALPAPPVSSCSVGPGGALAVVLASGELMLETEGGRRRVPLGAGPLTTALAPLPLPDASWVVGLADRAVRVTPEGRVLADVVWPALAGLLHGGSGTVLGYDHAGTWSRWGPGRLARVGSFGGAASSVALGRSVLVALTAPGVVEVPVRGGEPRSRGSMAPLEPWGPLALGEDGVVFALDARGDLVGIEPNGAERLRVTGEGFLPPGPRAALPCGPVVDAHGSVVAAPPGADLIHWRPGAEATRVRGSQVLQPTSLVPGRGRLALFCATGVVVILGEPGARGEKVP